MAASHVLCVAHHRVMRNSVSCPPIYRIDAGCKIEEGPMELLHRAFFVFVLLRTLEAAATTTASSTAAVVIIVVVEEAEIRILSFVPVKSGGV